MVLKQKKEQYPEKRYMNLYYKPDRTTKPATIALYTLFVLVLLLALSKVLLYDIAVNLHDKEQEYFTIQKRLENYEEQLKGYPEIQLTYTLYSKTEEEMAQVERMDILDLIDETIRTVGQVESISIAEEQVMVQVSGVTLSQTAEMVQELEKSSIVVGTTVNTAFTTEDNKDEVNANILIELQTEGGQ